MLKRASKDLIKNLIKRALSCSAFSINNTVFPRREYA